MECSIYQTIKRPGVSQRRIKQIVFFVLEKLKKNQAAVSVHLIGDKKMKRMNSDYRGKDKVTDVLSFVLHDDSYDYGFSIKNEAIDYGDIFICIPQIKRQAIEYDVSFQEELTRMLVHGVLHLFGYDHVRPRDAKKMMPLQEKMVSQLKKKK